MPHYKNGVPARVQDLLIHTDRYSKRSDLGILVSITPNADTCNGQLLPVAVKYPGAATWLPILPVNSVHVTLGDCLPVLADDSPAATAKSLTDLPKELTEASPQGDGDPRASSAT